MAALPSPLRMFGALKGLNNPLAPRASAIAPRFPFYGDPGRSAYLTNHRSPLMQAWQPSLREPQVDVQRAWLISAAQAVETMASSGWIAGGINVAIGKIISERGLHQYLKPWGGVVSSDPKLQSAWARDVEGRFELYINNPWNVDWGGRRTLAQIVRQGLRQYFGTGEMVMTFPFQERVGASHGTKVNLMPSSRLSQGNGPQPNIVQGVRIDPTTGGPTGYLFHDTNYADGTITERLVDARDEVGRMIVMHLFEGDVSAVRGITPLAPALRVIRQYDQLAEGTLTLVLLQTIFAATVESGEMTESIMRALQDPGEQDSDGNPTTFNPEIGGVQPGDFDRFMGARFNWYESTNIDLGRFGKIAHLFPGEKLNFNRMEHPNSDYQNFSKGLLAEVAQCLGTTGYELTGIYDGYTYTTAKMATDQAWPTTLWRRAHYAAPVYQTSFENWLEEDIARGNTVLPGGLPQFYAQKDLICRSDWRGPPKPVADEEKAARANQIRRAEGWASTESIAAEYGTDWVETADAQRAVDEYRAAAGLPPLPSLGGGGNGAGSGMVNDGRGVEGTQRSSSRAYDEMALVGAIMRRDQRELDALAAHYTRYYYG